MYIQNFKPYSATAIEDGGLGDGSFDMQTLLSTGAMDEQFAYKTVTQDEVSADGWYKSGEDTLATKTFTPGEGVFYYSYYDDAVMNFSGEVEMGAVDVPLREDYQVIGNIRPMNVNIQDFVPHSDDALSDGGLGDGSFDMQTLLSTGAMDEQFAYKTVTQDEVAADGWYKTGEDTLSDKVITAGTGLFFYSYYDDAFIRFKAISSK